MEIEPKAPKPSENVEPSDHIDGAKDEIPARVDSPKGKTLSSRPLRRRLGLRRAAAKPYERKGHAPVEEGALLAKPSSSPAVVSFSSSSPGHVSSSNGEKSSQPPTRSLAPEDIFFQPMPKLPPTPEKSETLSGKLSSTTVHSIHIPLQNADSSGATFFWREIHLQNWTCWVHGKMLLRPLAPAKLKVSSQIQKC